MNSFWAVEYFTSNKPFDVRPDPAHDPEHDLDLGILTEFLQHLIGPIIENFISQNQRPCRCPSTLVSLTQPFYIKKLSYGGWQTARRV